MANAKKKITKNAHAVKLAKMRQNPAFRKAEKEMRLKAEIGVEYISRVLKQDNPQAYVDENSDFIEGIGGMVELHFFLEQFDVLSYDYEDHMDENGILSPDGISSTGKEFVAENDRDKEKAKTDVSSSKGL